MLKNDTLKNGTSRIGFYGSPPLGNASVRLSGGTITSPAKVRRVMGIPCQFFIECTPTPDLVQKQCNLTFKQKVKLHSIAEIRAYWVETNLLRSTTLDIITRLLDNAAFFRVHVMGRFLGSACVEKSRVSASG